MIKIIKIKTFEIFYLDLVVKYLLFYVIVSFIKDWFRSVSLKWGYEKLVCMSQLIRRGIN